jgi:uncharacterized protein
MKLDPAPTGDRVSAATPPGLHFEAQASRRPTRERPAHGVPLFIGVGAAKREFQWRTPPAFDIAGWEHFEACIRVEHGSYLSHAVKGFFANGGELCSIYLVAEASQLQQAFRSQGPLEDVTGIDLICVPDAARLADAQAADVRSAVLEHCESMGTRFALLDAAPADGPVQADDLRAQASRHRSACGALYFPWLQVATVGSPQTALFVPPCGHVAGVYARTDAHAGVHKAPANERLDGAIATQWAVNEALHGELNAAGVNCIRNVRNRGIRVWGARTLGGRSDWLYVPVVRVVLALKRWLLENMNDIVFESHTPELWQRVERRIAAFCFDLFDTGALGARDPSEAFFVKCDAELNPPEIRDTGTLVAEVGLAVAVPAEFVVVRIVHDASGIVLIGP